MSDDNKIRIQLAIDIEEYVSQVLMHTAILKLVYFPHKLNRLQWYPAYIYGAKCLSCTLALTEDVSVLLLSSDNFLPPIYFTATVFSFIFLATV